MMRIVSVPGYGMVTLRFNSWIARLGGKNNCITLNARTIRVAQDNIGAMTFAHEWGHILQAKRLGWRYLPWVLMHYARSGYANSLPEREADVFMWKHWRDFPGVVYAPTRAAS